MPRNTRLTFELMETLVELFNCQGDASMAGDRLQINQPSMSKRLKLLQQHGRIGPTPWVQRRGKTWLLTDEGKRCLPAVQQLLRLEQSLISDLDTRLALHPTIMIACGQTAVSSLLREPLLKFRKEFKNAKVRVSTPRGSIRIEGVANGTYDFALVTHNADDIYRIAGRPLYMETLFEDPLVLVCGKRAPAGVRKMFESLPKKAATIQDLTRFPLILPEPDAGLRRNLDHAFSEKDLFGQIDIVLEVGGWSSTLDFVRDGWGVGIVARAAVVSENGLLPPHALDLPESPATAVRLITRQTGSSHQPDLLPGAQRLVELLREK